MARPTPRRARTTTGGSVPLRRRRTGWLLLSRRASLHTTDGHLAMNRSARFSVPGKAPWGRPAGGATWLGSAVGLDGWVSAAVQRVSSLRAMTTTANDRQ